MNFGFSIWPNVWNRFDSQIVKYTVYYIPNIPNRFPKTIWYQKPFPFKLISRKSNIDCRKLYSIIFPDAYANWFSNFPSIDKKYTQPRFLVSRKGLNGKNLAVWLKRGPIFCSDKKIFLVPNYLVLSHPMIYWMSHPVSS